jgi:nucleoside phosphorylase
MPIQNKASQTILRHKTVQLHSIDGILLTHSAAGVTAATALSAATKSQAANANERIRIGFIGPGGQRFWGSRQDPRKASRGRC